MKVNDCKPVQKHPLPLPQMVYQYQLRDNILFDFWPLFIFYWLQLWKDSISIHWSQIFQHSANKDDGRSVISISIRIELSSFIAILVVWIFIRLGWSFSEDMYANTDRHQVPLNFNLVGGPRAETTWQWRHLLDFVGCNDGPPEAEATSKETGVVDAFINKLSLECKHMDNGSVR